MQSWGVAALVVIIAYLLGSVPFGLLLTRAAGTQDLRSIGSGNIGATNVLRTGRKGLAAATLLLDAAKGAAAVLLAQRIAPGLAAAAGGAAFVGHLHPVWLRFRGGKGVATFLGVALALAPLCGALFAAAWLGMLGLTRYSSVAGISGGAAAAVTAAIADRFDLGLLFLVMWLLMLWTHRENIERLLEGTEPHVGRGS